MKDYKDVARSVFRRRDEYLKEKKRKREVFIKRSAVALSCCLMMLVGFNIWRTDSLKTIAPSPDKSQFNVTEANTTAPPTTDENGNTGIPVTATTAVVPANNGETAVQNGTTVTTVSGENAPAVTTTRKKNSSSTVEPPLPTTFSFMEVTAARRTTVVTTTTGRTSTVRTVTGKTTTTTHRSTTENGRTSARTTTARTTTRSKLTTTTARTTRTTTTTRLNTTSVSYSTTRVYTTSSAVYSTTRIYTTSSAVYSTTRAYTTKIPDTTVVTTIKPSDSPSPVATESVPYYTTTSITTTTIATTVTTTSITGFRYNGNYYRTTGSTISRYDLGTSIAAERDDTTGLNLVFYKYGDIDLDFMCVAVIYGQNTGYIGVNEVWNPDTLGDILNGANAEKTMKAASLYDYNDKRFYVFSDQKSAFDLLRDYSDRPAQIAGLSNGAQRFMLQNAGEEPPALDTSNKLGSIHIVTSGLADDGNYLHFGYIHITDDGKLEVDLFYLKYTIDIGRDNAEELVNKLKTL